MSFTADIKKSKEWALGKLFGKWVKRKITLDLEKLTLTYKKKSSKSPIKSIDLTVHFKFLTLLRHFIE